MRGAVGIAEFVARHREDERKVASEASNVLPVYKTTRNYGAMHEDPNKISFSTRQSTNHVFADSHCHGGEANSTRSRAAGRHIP